MAISLIRELVVTIFRMLIFYSDAQIMTHFLGILFFRQCYANDSFKKIYHFFLLIIIQLFIPSVGFAIGDSSGGCGSPPIIAAAAWGTSEELDKAILERVDQLRNPNKSSPSRNFLVKLLPKLNFSKILEPIDQTVKRVLNDTYHCRAPSGHVCLITL